LYISNAKLTNLWETAVSLYCFFALPVNSRRSARGRMPPPLRYGDPPPPGGNSFLITLQKLHFYLESGNRKDLCLILCGFKVPQPSWKDLSNIFSQICNRKEGTDGILKSEGRDSEGVTETNWLFFARARLYVRAGINLLTPERSETRRVSPKRRRVLDVKRHVLFVPGRGNDCFTA